MVTTHLAPQKTKKVKVCICVFVCVSVGSVMFCLRGGSDISTALSSENRNWSSTCFIILAALTVDKQTNKTICFYRHCLCVCVCLSVSLKHKHAVESSADVVCVSLQQVWFQPVGFFSMSSVFPPFPVKLCVSLSLTSVTAAKHTVTLQQASVEHMK